MTHLSAPSDASGIPAGSRWLSEAIPPENRYPTTRTPAGVPASHRHAIHSHHPPIPSHLRYQEAGTRHRRGVASPPARISRRSCPRLEWRAAGRGRCGRSRPSPRRPQTYALPFRFYARVKKGFIHLDIREYPPFRFPLAGRLRCLHRQRIGTRRCAGLHCTTGSASSSANVPGRIRSHASEIGSRIRRTISRLIGDGRHDADTPAGVLKNGGILFPVVSLRSTPGYRLKSLRDNGTPMS